MPPAGSPAGYSLAPDPPVARRVGPVVLLDERVILRPLPFFRVPR